MTDNETVQRWATEVVLLRPAKRADYVLRRSDSKYWYVDRVNGGSSDFGGSWSADQITRMLEPSQEADRIASLESALHARDERIRELTEALKVERDNARHQLSTADADAFESALARIERIGRALSTDGVGKP